MKRKPQQVSHPWSLPIAVADVPEGGRHLRLVADERVRSAVAELAGLRSLPRLEANFDLIRHGRDGLHVVGRISATIGQTCVVTLEPIEDEVEEAIDLLFAPGAPVILEQDGETVEVISESSAEPLVGGVVDLGSIATEFLILAINPYPRKPGAVFESQVAESETNHPFSALASLKMRDKTED